MSGQTLNNLIAAVFLRASDPPSASMPIQFDARAPETSTSASVASCTDPAETTLSLLARARQISDSIGVISANDELRDISTSSLRTLFLVSLESELHSAIRTGTDHSARKQRLSLSQQAAARFLNRTLALGVAPPNTKQLLGWTLANVPADELMSIGLESSFGTLGTPPHAREVKIAVFKLERALKSNLEHFRNAYQAKQKLGPEVKVPGDVVYDLLLYPRSSSDDDEDDEDEEESERSTSTIASSGIVSVRQYLLAMLNVHMLRTAQCIASASQELELLRSMPALPRPTSRAAADTSESEQWRLDRSTSRLPTSGPLMTPQGKVLRPFTITSASREEVASNIFQPSYRLPTMSIDEYLEEEQRRGNIIQGGGQASYDAPTSTEQRKLTAENDGSKDAQQAEEEQRQIDLHWDQFTEHNKRGAGNTMNRG